MALPSTEDRLESLDTQTVQGRCTVQENRMLGDDVFQNIPYFGGR